MTDAPQVAPLPNAVSKTKLLVVIFPLLTHSSSAIGIEAEVVLPTVSILLKTRCFSIRRQSATAPEMR